jgi:chemotaxis protein methyltransferase CheR
LPDLRGSWQQVQAFMRRACGVDLADDQIYLLEARLAPIVAERRFASLASFVDAACARAEGSALGMSLVDAMTTHETFFFRDAPFWRAFEEVVVPRAREGPKGLRIWSAACSHGQEPYSIAMLLEERWPELAARSTIVGTDVSVPAIERAREGQYSVLEVNRGLGAARLLRHFERGPGGGFRVQGRLRERVEWGVENLLAPAAHRDAFDVVLCRNVLIYFKDRDRLSVLARVGSATRVGGFLGLGVTEVGPGLAVSPGWFQRLPPGAL